MQIHFMTTNAVTNPAWLQEIIKIKSATGEIMYDVGYHENSARWMGSQKGQFILEGLV